MTPSPDRELTRLRRENQQLRSRLQAIKVYASVYYQFAWFWAGALFAAVGLLNGAAAFVAGAMVAFNVLKWRVEVRPCQK